MNCRILCESCGNIYRYKKVPFTCLSNIIDTTTSRYYDDCGLNVNLMMEQLNSYHGEVMITSPSINDWVKAYQEAEVSFVLTNSSLLSSSYHNALVAKNKCKELNPEKQIIVFNANTTGPGLALLIEKLAYYIAEMETIEEIEKAMNHYIPSVNVMIATKNVCSLVKEKVFTSFITKYFNVPILTNLKTHKVCLNENESLKRIILDLKKNGFSGKRMIISQNENDKRVAILKNMLYKEFGPIQIDVQKNSGINSYYFGKDAILLGYER